MSGSRRRTLELVYSSDGPVRVVEPGAEDVTSENRDPVEEAQAIERFLTYLYGELHSLNKPQPAQLVGAAILALRDDFDSGGRSGG
jgi:hypothetical protein